MRWSGPGLAIPFPFNLCPHPPPPPLLPDLHTSWTGTSRWLVFPLAFAQRAIPELSCHLEHIIRAPMTVKTGGICMCALNGTLEIIMTRSPRSLAHTLALSATQKSDHRLAVWVAASSLLLIHACTSCQGTRRRFEAWRWSSDQPATSSYVFGKLNCHASVESGWRRTFIPTPMGSEGRTTCQLRIKIFYLKRNLTADGFDWLFCCTLNVLYTPPRIFFSVFTPTTDLWC